LPESVLKRPKQAYRAPISGSFFSSSARDYTESLLSEQDLLATGLFNPASVSSLLHKIKNAGLITETDNMALSGILSMQLLYHQYIAKDQYRPLKPALTNCRIFVETNPLYT
jgi:asparagine synthase (glutamine-hydrolysing)